MIDLREADGGQIEWFFRQRPELLPFDRHCRADHVGAAHQRALFVFLTAGVQQFIQLRQIPRLRHRHQMIAPEVAALVLHPALLVAARRVAELALETPMRPERKEALRLFPLVATQDLLHRATQVVVAKALENAAKISERQLMRFQERLLTGVRIGAMKRSAARHAPQTEDVDFLLFPVQLGPRLVPVHLAFLRPRVTLRDEDLLAAFALRGLPRPDVLPHRGLCHGMLGLLFPQPVEDPPRRMPLLPVRLLVGRQNRVDEVLHRFDLWLGSLRSLPRRWYRARDRLAHDSPVHAELLCYAFDRPNSMVELSPQLFVKLHFRPPFQPAPLPARKPVQGSGFSGGGPN